VVYIINKSPLPPGLLDLKTDAAMPAIMHMQRGNIPPTFSMGADADLDNNGKISSAEGSGITPYIFGGLLDSAYQVLRRYYRASLITETIGIADEFNRIPVARFTFSTVATPGFEANDTVVTETSANPSWANSLGNIKANHTTIKTGTNIRKLINKTITLGR
jgi:hypothetical protein